MAGHSYRLGGSYRLSLRRQSPRRPDELERFLRELYSGTPPPPVHTLPPAAPALNEQGSAATPLPTPVMPVGPLREIDPEPPETIIDLAEPVNPYWADALEEQPAPLPVMVLPGVDVSAQTTRQLVDASLALMDDLPELQEPAPPAASHTVALALIIAAGTLVAAGLIFLVAVRLFSR